MPKALPLDPRSDRIVLAYSGGAAGEPHVEGVPARDLSENDLCRLLVVRGAGPAAADDLIAELTATGLYAPAREA